jgi:hypothetical protein
LEGFYRFRERGIVRDTLGPFHVYLSVPSLLWDLRAALQRVGCVAEQRRAHELEVYIPEAGTEKQARRHLNLSLASWQARNVGVEARVVDAVPAIGHAPPLTPDPKTAPVRG